MSYGSYGGFESLGNGRGVKTLFNPLFTKLENGKYEVNVDTIREIVAYQIMDHPNIMKAHKVSFDKKYCLQIEMDKMEDLYSILKRKNLLKSYQVDQIQKDCLSGLNYMHSNSITHSDIKPDNIFIDKNYRAYLGDFGSVRLHNCLKEYVGTKIYQAPESYICKKETCYANDVWSMGQTFLELGLVKFEQDLRFNKDRRELLYYEYMDYIGGRRNMISKQVRRDKSLILKMLEFDVKTRWTALDCWSYKTREPVVKGKLNIPKIQGKYNLDELQEYTKDISITPFYYSIIGGMIANGADPISAYIIYRILNDEKPEKLTLNEDRIENVLNYIIKSNFKPLATAI